MKISWNWGTKLFILIILFIFSVFFRVFLSYQRDVDLISNDYYPKGINYQKQINKKNNTSKLSADIHVLQTKDSVIIKFPELKGEITGQLYFYRPSNQKHDFKKNIKFDDNSIQKIDKKILKNGKYILKTDWKLNDSIAYYTELDVIIN